MADAGEAAIAYALFAALFFLLCTGVIGRVMGLTDPSAPTTPCCISPSDDVDDEEAQREQRVSFERESKQKRELKEYEQKHKQALLAKKGSGSRPPPRPKAATVESPNGKVLRKAAPPAGSSHGARPSSQKFAESLPASPTKGGSSRASRDSQGSVNVGGSSSVGRQSAKNSLPPGRAPGAPSSKTQRPSASTSRSGTAKGPQANKGAAL